MSLFLGFEGDPGAAGASSANHWIYENQDIDMFWQHPADEMRRPSSPQFLR